MHVFKVHKYLNYWATSIYKIDCDKVKVKKILLTSLPIPYGLNMTIWCTFISLLDLNLCWGMNQNAIYLLSKKPCDDEGNTLSRSPASTPALWSSTLQPSAQKPAKSTPAFQFNLLNS